MSSVLTSLSDDLVEAVENASSFVVGINARPRGASGFFRNGVIITAEHAVHHEDELTVTLPSGASHKAVIVGRDPGTDIAVLQLPATTEPGDLKRLTHASAEPAPESACKPGTLVLAVGRSTENGISATMGVISSVGDRWRTWRGGMIDRFIRLDVAMYPGSSGGAVVDSNGKLLGLATRGLSRISAIAVPIATVDRVAAELLSKGHVARGYLGVGLQPVTLPDHLVTKASLSNAAGMIVLSVEPEAPAGIAGLLIGDVLTALDGKPVGDTDDVQAALEVTKIGNPIRASILRGGELKEIAITVAERPRRG